MNGIPHVFRRTLCVFLTAVLVFSCVPALADGGITQWINTDVEDAVGLLTMARLKDDFHLAVNRQWLMFEEIPWGASEASSFADQSYEVMGRKLALLKDSAAESGDSRLIQKFLGLVQDWDTRNALGTDPLRPYVEAITAISSLDDLTDYMVSPVRNTFMLDPSAYSVTPDPVNSSRYIACVAPAELILDDSAEYIERTAYGDLLYDVSKKSTVAVLTRMGYTREEAESVFEGALALDALMAPAIRPASDQYDPDYLESVLHFYDREGLEKLSGRFPMAAILDLTPTGQSETFWIPEPAYLEKLNELYTEENVPLFKDWLIYYLLAFYAKTLDRGTYDALETIEADALGITGIPDDIDIALTTVSEYLPVPLDNLYIQTYCTEAMRAEILEIIHDVIRHYRIMLSEEDWLSEETREKAIEKLDRMRINAVYPDQLADWSGVSFKGKDEGGTLLEAVLALNDYSYQLYCSRINQPVDRDAWDQLLSPASTVNAHYLSTSNSISILAGILGTVFYQPEMSYEEKLGGIGMVIAHEISHAFDPDGANYDADGNLVNWWTPEDYAAFRARAQKVAAYYDQYVPYKGGTYSGIQVQSEAIADMGSMKCMLAIAREHEGFDYNAFFRQFARIWRTKMLKNSLIVSVATDSHPLGCLRTNVTVQQFEEFYLTYNVQEGDQMYLAPEDRIAVW